MPAKKKSVTTPLHLLQQLSHSLIEHLDKACSQAIKDAEGALAKLQKQRGKAQDKLTKARVKLDEAGSTGKPKAQTKARARLGELEESLTLLQTRQSETLNYLAELKRDAEHSLKLAQGIRQVADAADQALQGRQQPTKPAAARPAAGKSAPVAAKPRASTTRAPAAKADSAPAKAGTTTTASKPAAKPAAKSPAKAAAKPAAKAPASAAAKPATTGASASKAPARSRAAAGSKAPASAAKKAAASAEAPDKAAAAKPATKATAKKPVARKPAAKRAAAQPAASSS